MPTKLVRNAETWQVQKYQRIHILMCVVMHLSYLENNLFKVLIIVFISTILTIGLTAFLMEKINKRINKK